MNTDEQTGPAHDDLVDRLTAHLEEQADAPAGFEDLSDELRMDSTYTGPPPALRQLLMAQVREAAASAVPEAEPEPAPSPAAVDRPVGAGRRGLAAALAWWRRRRGRLVWAVPAVALAAALFTVGVLVVDRALQPGDPHGTVYQATGTGLAPRARAEVEVRDSPSGFSIEVRPDGLPAAAIGSYYGAWLRGPRGTVPIGSFHMRDGDAPIRLWSGVDPADYPTFLITLQAEGEPPTPSTRVVMTAPLNG